MINKTEIRHTQKDGSDHPTKPRDFLETEIAVGGWGWLYSAIYRHLETNQGRPAVAHNGQKL